MDITKEQKKLSIFGGSLLLASVALGGLHSRFFTTCTHFLHGITTAIDGIATFRDWRRGEGSLSTFRILFRIVQHFGFASLLFSVQHRSQLSTCSAFASFPHNLSHHHHSSQLSPQLFRPPLFQSRQSPAATSSISTAELLPRRVTVPSAWLMQIRNLERAPPSKADMGAAAAPDALVG
ncbi:hypothetical protein BJ508DRAFT_151682 [Ascobolus immersus RN42]|uniref:Uncharacterized protein n=1 Tax=Ascobolus immersus RN42 TaxID=1160509 RepID=A0A3N4I3S4_ASCIM|nr:hypothetical protein BJ508DRAFT_151682 [Ascobolus immersus RN42]